MFRDPPFFLALRKHVIPFLKTYPFVKIWHAGCATGEEAYSMAILMNEAGLQGRYRIYATDVNEAVLEKAKEGIYPLADMQRFTYNYQKSGGTMPFSDYYTAHYDRAIFMSALKKDIVFSQHNLVIDHNFGDMHLVLCRNVMIYFKQALKDRCLGLFDQCLQAGGFLCVGTKETLSRNALVSHYEEFVPPLRIYQKSYAARY
jgi:chemotaxis protein methyltransferase CheR